MFNLELFYLEHKKLIEYCLHMNRNNEGYKEKKISKKNGKKRKLLIPNKYLKAIQKRLLVVLNDYYIPTVSAHAFLSKDSGYTRTIMTNASKHTNKKIVINLDIKNFFDTINFGRIRGLFLSLKMDEFSATKLAQLVTIDNKLPQGAPTSPILSNMVAFKLDRELGNVSKKYRYKYTRYADDITFSSNNSKADIEALIEDIKKAIINNGFLVNEDKTRIQYNNQKQLVTGIKVNKKLNLDKKYFNQIRSMLHSICTEGIHEATKKHFDEFSKQKKKYKQNELSFQNILLGKINFIANVKGKQDSKYLYYRYMFFIFIEQSKNKISLHNKFSLVDINNLQEKEFLFKNYYDYILVVVEGVTDAIYINNALSYFQEKGEYTNLKLRFIYGLGWENAKNIYLEKLKQSDINYTVILDSDVTRAIDFFQNEKDANIFFILQDSSSNPNNKYIERLLPEETIKDMILAKNNTPIVPEKTKNKKTRQKLKQHIKDNIEKDDFFSVDGYILYKNYWIYKTELAQLISKNEDIDYSTFKEVFNYIDNL